jgi:hypothetical protein
MNHQPLGKLLKSDAANADTIVSWEKFVQLANIGDIYKFLGDEWVITHKVFDMTGPDQVKITLYSEER